MNIRPIVLLRNRYVIELKYNTLASCSAINEQRKAGPKHIPQTCDAILVYTVTPLIRGNFSMEAFSLQTPTHQCGGDSCPAQLITAQPPNDAAAAAAAAATGSAAHQVVLLQQLCSCSPKNHLVCNLAGFKMPAAHMRVLPAHQQ
jgi:hypothetical protein